MNQNLSRTSVKCSRSLLRKTLTTASDVNKWLEEVILTVSLQTSGISSNRLSDKDIHSSGKGRDNGV